MIQMKKYIYLLTIAALAAFGCTPEGPVDDANKEYVGNKAKVTLEDVIPATGGVAQAIVKSEVPFTVSVPKAATWLTVESISYHIYKVVYNNGNIEEIKEDIFKILNSIRSEI